MPLQNYVLLRPPAVTRATDCCPFSAELDVRTTSADIMYCAGYGAQDPPWSPASHILVAGPEPSSTSLYSLLLTHTRGGAVVD